MATLALGAVALAGCSSQEPTAPPTSVDSKTAQAPTDSDTTRIDVGEIAAYGSAVPGTPEALAELQQAKDIGFNVLLNYSSMNASTADIHTYLDQAKRLGIGLSFSTKDILGADDTDPQNVNLHQQWGMSTDAQMQTMASEFFSHSAVKSVFTADEQPDDSRLIPGWLNNLKKRHSQVSKSGKPSSVVLYWNGGNASLYKAAMANTDQMQIDYYPLPANSTYGPVETIADIGDMLYKVADNDGWFVVQAFGWDWQNHPESKELGFPAKSPPPTTAEMVNMAKLAVEGHGHGGAMNLVFYALGEPNAASPADVKAAVQQIRAADWWQHRGN